MPFDRVSRIWKVERGDTLNAIALAVYGSAGEYPRIFAANSPPVENPHRIEPGWQLLCPALQESAGSKSALISEISGKKVDAEAQLVLRMGAENLRFVSGLQVNYGLNEAVRTLAFSVPYRVEDLAHYTIGAKLEFAAGGVPIFSGEVVSIQPSVDSGAVLNIQAAHPAYWLQKGNYTGEQQEWHKSSLEQVLKAVLGDLAFSYSEAAQKAMQQVYAKVAIDEGQSVWDFVAKLASERGLLVQGLAGGALHFYKLESSKAAVAVFGAGGEYKLSAKYSFEELAQYYVVKNNKEGSGGSQRSQAENPFIKNGVTKIISNSEGSGSDMSAEWELAKALANAVQFDISGLNGICRPDGTLWQAGDVVVLQNDELGYEVGTELELLVQNVQLEFSGALSANLSCVLPETRSGKMPKTLPFMG